MSVGFSSSTDPSSDTGTRKIMVVNETISNNSKCDRWSLGKDVGNNPPLLEDMGLCPLQEHDSEMSKNYSSVSQASKILQPVSQNSKNYAAVFIQNDKNSEDFFVFKRRRLDTCTGEDKFNKLTEEVVLMIFKWLPKYMLARCAQVCKRWKRLAFDEFLWRRLDLGSKTLDPGVVGRVLLRGTFTLRLAKAEISSPVFCPQLQHLSSPTEIRSRLQNLDLSMAAIHPEALSEILSVCRQLKRVSLEHCTVNSECCQYLANNVSLDTLNLAMCYGLNKDCLLPVLANCTRLQSLNLAWTNLNTKDLTAICRSFPISLLRLNLSGCRSTLTDCHVCVLAHTAPSLLELDVSDASHLTAASVTTIINKLKELEYLAFARCFNITPSSYLGLRAMENLLYLDVYGILSDRDLATVKESLPNIKINKYLFSSVARPTVGIRRTSIWGFRVRD